MFHFNRCVETEWLLKICRLSRGPYAVKVPLFQEFWCKMDTNSKCHIARLSNSDIWLPMTFIFKVISTFAGLQMHSEHYVRVAFHWFQLTAARCAYLGDSWASCFYNKSVFSHLRTLTTCHCPHSPAAAAAIDRYLLPGGPTATNLQQQACYCGPDRRTGYADKCSPDNCSQDNCSLLTPLSKMRTYAH